MSDQEILPQASVHRQGRREGTSGRGSVASRHWWGNKEGTDGGARPMASSSGSGLGGIEALEESGEVGAFGPN